jgi:FtsH-binding integral membrane protein
MRLQGIWDILAGILGIVVLIAVLTGMFEFEYGWIGYVAAILLILWGIKGIVTKSYKRKK